MAIHRVETIDKALSGQSVEEKINTDLAVADAADVDEWLSYAAKLQREVIPDGRSLF